MIKINLLPSDKARKGGRSRVKSAPSGGAGFVLGMIVIVAACIGALGYAFWAYKEMADRQTDLAALTTDQNKLKAEAAVLEAEYKVFAAEADEIDQKFEVVKALDPANRVFWSEKLNMVARARLNLAVYVTNIELTEQITEIETPESVARREAFKNRKDKKTNEKEPAAIKRPIINQKLIIKAIAYGKDSPTQLRQVTAFSDNLTSLKWTRDRGARTSFLEGMKPDFGQLPMDRTAVGGIPVLQFGFIVEAQPQIDRSSEAKVGPGRVAAAAPAGGKK